MKRAFVQGIVMLSVLGLSTCPSATGAKNESVGSSSSHSGQILNQSKEEPFTDEEITIKDESGHHLLLPKDWPVAHQDSRVTPMSMEEYLSMKFGQVREAVTETNRRLDTVEQRLQTLEEAHTALLKALQLLQEQAHREEVAHGDTTKTP